MTYITTFTLFRFFSNKKSRIHIMIIPIKKTFCGKEVVEYAELFFFAFRRWRSRPNFVSVSYDFLTHTSIHIQYLGTRLGCFHWEGNMTYSYLLIMRGLSIIKWYVVPKS